MKYDFNKVSRRRLLRNIANASIISPVFLENLAGTQGFLQTLESIIGCSARSSCDAFGNLSSSAYALQALLSSSGTAFAQGESTEDWSVVTIKVLNHVYTPLVFALGQLDATQSDIASGVKSASVLAKAGAASQTLNQLGVEQLSDHPVYKSLRLNKWFANMLHNGTTTGGDFDATNSLGLTTTDIEPLQNDKVAIQTFLQLKQIAGQNHALKGVKLALELPDLSLFLHETGLIRSPLGIAAFMMGNQFDLGEGSVPTNAVLDRGITERIVIPGRAVSDFVNQQAQMIGQTYLDRRPGGLVETFDSLRSAGFELRKDLIASFQAFSESLPRFQNIAAMERLAQSFDASTGNGQSSKGGGASQEFLAQCRYVVESLKLPGKPLRNFSLFLNAVDLDGANLDSRQNNNDERAQSISAYSYIEAMRQLAMGLNTLGKAIASGEKLLVTVISEGGRDPAMGDSRTSFSLVMGPKGPGMLTDQLHANTDVISALESDVLTDPASSGAAVPWTGKSLMDHKGFYLKDTPASIGHVQMGLVQFLEERLGQTVRDKVAAHEAIYAQLARFS
jgi:hypothetical protein